jgi:hypothetical protein
MVQTVSMASTLLFKLEYRKISIAEFPDPARNFPARLDLIPCKAEKIPR